MGSQAGPATKGVANGTAEPRLHVAVIGAGLTGLLTAHGLKKRGFRVSIYDKEQHIGEREREWTVMVHWALPSLEKALPEDIFNDLRSTYTDPSYPYAKEESIPIYHGEKGFVAINTQGLGLRRFSRTRLRKLLTRGLDIQWDKSLEGITAPESGPVSVSFQDGSTMTADLVVGCDGPRSAVRRWLFSGEPGEAKSSEWLLCAAIVNYRDAELSRTLRAAGPIAAIAYLHDGLVFLAAQNVPDPKEPTTWDYHVVRIWKGKLDGVMAGREALREFRTHPGTDLICEPFRSAILRVPDDTQSVTISEMKYWVTVPWDNRGGRVTLAGDAAHAMLPSRGQGLNNAIMSVNNLLAQVERMAEGVSAVEALKIYEDEVVERGSKAVIGSLEDAVDLTKLEALHKSRMNQQGLKA